MKFGALLMAGAMALQAMGGFPAAAEAKKIDITDVTLTGIVQEVTETEVTLRIMGEKPENGERPEGRDRGKRGQKPAETTEAAEPTETTEATAETTTEEETPAEQPEEGREHRGGRRGGRGRGHRKGRGGRQTVTLTVVAELLTDIEKGDCVTITTDAEGVVTALTENAKPERPQKQEESTVETAEKTEMA